MGVRRPRRAALVLSVAGPVLVAVVTGLVSAAVLIVDHTSLGGDTWKRAVLPAFMCVSAFEAFAALVRSVDRRAVRVAVLNTLVTSAGLVLVLAFGVLTLPTTAFAAFAVVSAGGPVVAKVIGGVVTCIVMLVVSAGLLGIVDGWLALRTAVGAPAGTRRRLDAGAIPAILGFAVLLAAVVKLQTWQAR